METNGDNLVAKSGKLYYCDICDYKCFKKYIPYIGEGTGKTEMFNAGDTTSDELKEIMKNFMLEIVSKIRNEVKPTVNTKQLDELFKKGEL